VAQSTAEPKFVVATAAVYQVMWPRKILNDLHLKHKEGTKIFVNNQTTIAISHNPIFLGKTKHFNIKLFVSKNVVFGFPNCCIWIFKFDYLPKLLLG